MLDLNMFKFFISKMNQHAIAEGLKEREYTEEQWAMVWKAFNEYNGGKGGPDHAEAYDGITREDLIYVSRHATF